GPFPNVSDQVENAPFVLPFRTRTHLRGRRILHDGDLVFPLRSPRIQIALLAVPRCVFPFLFGRQAITHTVALRSPCGKGSRIVKRNIHDRPQLLSKRGFVRVPVAWGCVICLSYELCVFGVGYFSAIHREGLYRHKVGRSFLKWTVLASHLERSAIDWLQFGFHFWRCDWRRRRRWISRTRTGSHHHVSSDADACEKQHKDRGANVEQRRWTLSFWRKIHNHLFAWSNRARGNRVSRPLAIRRSSLHSRYFRVHCRRHAAGQTLESVFEIFRL